jgi:hypothetical protein
MDDAEVAVRRIPKERVRVVVPRDGEWAVCHNDWQWEEGLEQVLLGR